MKKSPSDKHNDPDFELLIQALSVHTEAAHAIAQIEADLNQRYHTMVEAHRGQYTGLQEALTKTETQIKALAQKHPDWFAARKTLKTPFGTVKSTTTNRLEIPNPEVTVLLLEAAFTADPTFDVDAFIRTNTEPDVEALEKLDDATLAKFRITRVTDESIKVTPAEVKLGQAVKAINEAPKALALAS